MGNSAHQESCLSHQWMALSAQIPNTSSFPEGRWRRRKDRTNNWVLRAMGRTLIGAESEKYQTPFKHSCLRDMPVTPKKNNLVVAGSRGNNFVVCLFLRKNTTDMTGQLCSVLDFLEETG